MRYLMILLLVFLIIIPSDGFSQVIDVVYAVGENSTILKLEYGLWVPVDLGEITGCEDFTQIWGSSEDNIYVTGCTNALLHYNGGEWQRITIPVAGYGTEQLLAVGGTEYDNVIVGGLIFWGSAIDGVAYHFDGTEWTSIHNDYGGTDGIRKIWADPGGGLYATGCYYHYLNRSAYDVVMRYYGGIWSTELMEDPDYSQEFNGIGGFSPGGPVVVGHWYNPMAGTGGGIWAKFGSSWTNITQSQDVECGMYSKYCPVWPVDWFAVLPVSYEQIWVAGEEGRVLHWTPTGYTEYNTSGMNTLRAIWGNSNSDIYAVGDGGKIVHFDGGTWSEMASPTTENLLAIWGHFELPIATLLQAFSTGIDLSGITLRWTLSEIDEGVDFRVLRSVNSSGAFVIDDGSNIERNDLSFKYIDSDVQPGEDYAYIVEYSDDGEWKLLLETDRITVPKATFGLMTNYPNPFNPSTKITYSTPGHGHVSLKIYDVSGKLVRTIINEVQGPGEHYTYWNGVNDQGDNVSSGTYFCRLISAKQAVTRKMLLMR